MRTFWPAPPRPTNLVDEFWDQLHAIPRSEVEAKKQHATWMLHHPIDVALAVTHQYLRGIASADDQLKAFVEFWVPTDTVRRNRLHEMLSKQACWERTSWIPFSRKVQVLPARFAHNAFMFSALVATATPHVYGHVSGRYTNAAPTASSYCKNNCRPPIVDGKWLPSEEAVLTNFVNAELPPHIGLVTTVRLLRSMILTLLSPTGHISFVLGIPTIFDGRIGFNCFNTLPRYFESTVEIPAWKPHARPDEPRFVKATRGPEAVRGPKATRGPIAPRGPDSRSAPYRHGDATINNGVSVADMMLVAAVTDHMNSAAVELRRGDDAVANDLAHGLSIEDPKPYCREPDPTPSYRADPEPVCRDDSPSTSWGGDSSSNCNSD
jgi:hypothetical protein